LCADIIQPNEFTREYTEDSSESVALIRAANVRDSELDLSDFVFVAKAKLESKSFDASYIQEGDLLITRTGAKAGETCAVPPLSRPYIVSSHSIRVVPRKESVEPRYLEMFLVSRWGKAQVNRLFTGAAQPQLQLSTVSQLQISIPARPQQIALVAAMDAARAERRAKLAEADALLAGLDDFLLATLGLTPPPKDDRKVFAVPTKTVPGRFDPHFYLPELMQNLRMLTNAGSEPLGSLVSFSDEVWKPAAHSKPTFRYIEISGVSPQTGEARAEETAVAEAPSRARMAVKTHDIIVSLTRPHHGSIAQNTPPLDGCVASTGFSVLRGISQRVNREYLWCVLRTKMCLKQMLQRASGGNYPAITEPELAKVLVPVPKPEVQEVIAAEARRRREAARRLREEAETSWREAKDWFEAQLLNKV